jgi:hypothetical protein
MLKSITNGILDIATANNGNVTVNVFKDLNRSGKLEIVSNTGILFYLIFGKLI